MEFKDFLLLRGGLSGNERGRQLLVCNAGRGGLCYMLFRAVYLIDRQYLIGLR